MIYSILNGNVLTTLLRWHAAVYHRTPKTFLSVGYRISHHSCFRLSHHFDGGDGGDGALALNKHRKPNLNISFLLFFLYIIAFSMDLAINGMSLSCITAFSCECICMQILGSYWVCVCVSLCAWHQKRGRESLRKNTYRINWMTCEKSFGLTPNYPIDARRVCIVWSGGYCTRTPLEWVLAVQLLSLSLSRCCWSDL